MSVDILISNYLILTLHITVAEYEVDRMIVENIKEQNQKTQKVSCVNHSMCIFVKD